jgi:hypothetical protein
MLRIVREDGRVIDLGDLTDQVYSMEDQDGTQYHWSVAAGLRLATARGQVWTVSLRQMGVTADLLRSLYHGLDEAHALTTDLSRPLLFVPFRGEDQLIDGWHRLLKAALTGVDALPAYFLTQAEADACLVCVLPPGRGLDWGQRPLGGRPRP